MIQRLANHMIYNTFISLWRRKACKLPFTEREFEDWCENFMPESTICLVLVDSAEVTGGVIFYPMQLPSCLFVQLMIALNPREQRLFKEPMLRVAKAMGYDRFLCACPGYLEQGMERLFNMKKMGTLFSWIVH